MRRGFNPTACLLLVTFLLTCSVSSQKHVSILLNAKWKDTNFLQEASEFIAEEDTSLFWRFLSAATSQEPPAADLSDEELYSRVIGVAGTILTPQQLNILRWSLALRADSPSVDSLVSLSREVDSRCPGAVMAESDGVVACDSDALEKMLKNLTPAANSSLLFSFDHIWPACASNPAIVILYANVAHESFIAWHDILSKRCSTDKFRYVLRHYATGTSGQPVRLAGYGIELAIKSQEYRAQDDEKINVQDAGAGEDGDGSETDEVEGFNFSRLKELYPQKSDQLDELRAWLDTVGGELPQLKAWQVQDVSVQAAAYVLGAPRGDQLRLLRDVSQDFPTQVGALSKVSASSEMIKEMEKNQESFQQHHGLPAGESLLLVNGRTIDFDTSDIWHLLTLLRSEALLGDRLHKLGLSQEQVWALSRTELSTSVSTNFAVDFRHEGVVWINDLESDAQYKSWSKSLRELLQPAFFSPLRHIRHNVFSLLVVVDPTDPESWETLKLVEAFYVHQTPLRLGVVLVPDEGDEVGAAVVRAFNWAMREEGGGKALGLLTDMFELVKSGEELTHEEVSGAFKSRFGVKQLTEMTALALDSPEFVSGQEFYSSVGFTSLPVVMMNGVPLSSESIAEGFEEAVVNEIVRQTPEIQKAVYKDELTEDVVTWLMSRPNVLQRLNQRLLDPPATVVDLATFHSAATDAVPTSWTDADGATVLQKLAYLTKKDSDDARAVTMWVVADLDTQMGRLHAYNAIKQLKSSNDYRLAILHNPADSEQLGPVSRAVAAACDTQTPHFAKLFVTKLLKDENVADLLSGPKSEGAKALADFEVNGMNLEAFLSRYESNDIGSLTATSKFVETILLLEKGATAVVVNGRVFGPLPGALLVEDFALAEKLAHATADDLLKKLGHFVKDGNKIADVVMKVDSILSTASSTSTENLYSGKKKRVDLKFNGNKHSALHLPPRREQESAFEVVAIVDPASRSAQKLSQLVLTLYEATNSQLTIYLNCQRKLSEVPLKSYFRYVLPAAPQFTDTGARQQPSAVFKHLPSKPLLSMITHPPESWLIEPVRCSYDLDNICLDECETSVTAVFELEYILLEGHAFDSRHNPPRGLQFVLGSPSEPALQDTIVMANLGYFQLKSNPGVWQLQLRDGPSADIYTVTGQQYTDSPPDSDRLLVVINNFRSKVIQLTLAKKPGKENEELLAASDGDEASGGFWNSLSSTLGGKKDSAAGSGADETINVFSVASGHLYERFLRIMMLSVLKNTKSPVKFWFLKNFLSPTFKEFIPKMAVKYGFKYELVQYKWPRWLHQQTEKQRIIWGYKILFLDVLFPLDVNRVIFVDADQTIRADLKELMDMDLDGAPYGYTPFCSSRTEMDGFRFWKTGYWASHLNGRSYHISALYVIDLRRFRQLAAGDRLRGQYQGLSADPNSLANLDQDLPNNMIHQVAIKSLPQDWLWCETWCSDASKSSAKTIDLCNNPQTKEPKLDAARRIVPEWTEYDNEVRRLWDEVFPDRKNVKIPVKPTTNSDSKKDHKHTDL